MRQCVLGNAVLQVVKSIVLIGFELLGCDIVVSLNEGFVVGSIGLSI